MGNDIVPANADAEIVPCPTEETKPAGLAPYQGVSSAAVTPEQAKILGDRIPQEDLDVLPTGEVYASQVRYRRILNAAFGPGGWALVPRGPVTVRENILYREYALFAGGRFIAESIGEQEYFESNNRMSWATAAEAVKSNALTRCCKDLGIASECWDRRFTQEFKAKYCVKVYVKKKNGETKAEWRRKDAEPLYGESGIVQDKPHASVRNSAGDAAPRAGRTVAAPDTPSEIKRRGHPPKAKEEPHPDLPQQAPQGPRPDGKTQAAFNELADAFLRFKSSGDKSLTDEQWWTSITHYEKIGNDGKQYVFESKSLGDAEALMNSTYKKFGNAKNVFIWLKKAKETFPHLFEESLEQQAEEIF
jgi:hypothetical protein